MEYTVKIKGKCYKEEEGITYIDIQGKELEEQEIKVLNTLFPVFKEEIHLLLLKEAVFASIVK